MTQKLLTSLMILLILAMTGCADREQQSIELVKKGKKKLSMGLNDQALEYFDDAIKKNNENHEAWHFRGSCKVSLGLPLEGIPDFGKAIELKPDYAPAWYNRGLAWFYLGEQQKACEDWKQAEALGYPNIGDKTRHCR
ncbi:MAG: tetratricopeptide repeat protein [Bacteroidales bacterium]